MSADNTVFLKCLKKGPLFKFSKILTIVVEHALNVDFPRKEYIKDFDKKIRRSKE